ncbi:hypothetical protein [Halalkalibacillus halophilus]|uniref:hypothetical protein n=1 Tax=Halalkalibacillus halophilus TaxID=392827 RepID=UPI00041830FC|nr:hypothetical protein [Halalkalibacillus halophilus]
MNFTKNVNYDPKMGQVVKLVVDGIYKENPKLYELFGHSGLERCTEDNFFHMRYLHTSYQLNNPSVFEDYTEWLHDVLTSRKLHTEHIIQNFELMYETIDKMNDKGNWDFHLERLEDAIESLRLKL